MAIPKNLVYPADATNSAWQKKKSLFDKLTHATGMGDSLKGLEKDFKAINFKLLDVKSLDLNYMNTEEEVEADKAKAVTELKKVKELLRVLALAISNIQKESALKGLSKDTIKAIQHIGTTLEGLVKQLKSINLDDFDELIKSIAENRESRKKGMAGWIGTVKKGLSALKATPKRVKWESEAMQSLDDLHRYVFQYSDYKDIRDQWKNIKYDMFLNEPALKVPGAQLDPDEEKKAILKLVDQVEKALALLE